MKRRDFNKSIVALFAAPAIPFKAFAAAPATAAGIPPPNLYTWSTAIARTHGKCSAEMLKNMLHVDAAQASNLFSKLIANNVLAPANAVGFSQARSIMPPATGIREAVAPADPLDQVKQALDRVKSVLKEDDPVVEAESGRYTDNSAEDVQCHLAAKNDDTPQT